MGRMAVLDQVGLTETQELSVLEFCCEISSMPYNRRTSCSLKDIIQCVAGLKKEEGGENFQLSMRQGFRWWWAFTKKHSIISLYYQEQNKASSSRSESASPENLLSILSNPYSIPITIPSSMPLHSFLGLSSHSKYSLRHP